jgi:acyl carrier protein
MAFEEAFEVVIPEAAAATMITVQDTVDYIEQQKSG